MRLDKEAQEAAMKIECSGCMLTACSCALAPLFLPLTQDLYKYDCLRANKSTMAWGVEARVPFLDKEFLNVAMSIDPSEKMIDKSKGGLGGWACACTSCAQSEV